MSQKAPGEDLGAEQERAAQDFRADEIERVVWSEEVLSKAAGRVLEPVAQLVGDGHHLADVLGEGEVAPGAEPGQGGLGAAGRLEEGGEAGEFHAPGSRRPGPPRGRDHRSPAETEVEELEEVLGGWPGSARGDGVEVGAEEIEERGEASGARLEGVGEGGDLLGGGYGAGRRWGERGSHVHVLRSSSSSPRATRKTARIPEA